MYTDLVMDHFTNPRNVGEIEDADGVGQIGNPVCGDVMRISIAVDDKDHIEDVKFKTFGCGAAVATSSMVTEMVMGKSLTEAADISNKAVAEALGGLPANKMHCSNLAADALHLAIQDYLVKSGREAEVEQILKALPKEHEHSSH
jgi:nitrogen fixation protein NifU and related proteins